MEAKASQPTLLLQAGPLAATVCRLLLRSLGNRLRQATDGRGEHDVGIGLPNLAVAGLPADAGRLRDQMDRLLSLPELISHVGSAAPPNLMVYVVADLSEAGAASALRQGIDELLHLVRTRYAPVFRQYRGDAQTNFHCNPVLVLPATGDVWPPEVQQILTHLEQLHGGEERPPPVSNIFVISETSGRYRLSRDQIAEMVFTWLDQAIFGALGRSEVFERALRRETDPYATFVCATAEFDARAARHYCAMRMVTDLLNWMRHTSTHRIDVDQRAALLEELFDITRFQELVPLEKGNRLLAQAIDSQCPSFTGEFRDVGLFEDTEETLAHYSEAWYRRNRGRLEAATRELDLFRIDEIIEEVEANGAMLVATERDRIDRFIEQRLNSTDEGNVADTAVLLRHLRKRLAAEVDAVQRRATAQLAPEPDLKKFDRTNRAFVEAARQKPKRRRTVFWGLLVWVLISVGAALLLRHLVPLLGPAPDSVLRVVLTPPWAWLTTIGASGIGVAIYVLSKIVRRAREVRRFVGESRKNRRGELLSVLEELSRAGEGSLQSYYGSRFLRACDTWVHRTLKAVLKHVENRLERVSQMLTVLEHQVKTVQELRRHAGVEVVADRHQSSDGATLGESQGMLRRSLVDPAELTRLAAERREPRELAAAVRAYANTFLPFKRWRAVLPCARLADLLKNCETFYPKMVERSVLLQPDLSAEAKQRLARFMADFARRLDFHLDFAGWLHKDADDLNRSLSATVVVGQPVVEMVTEMIEEVSAGVWTILPDDSSGNRVVLLKMATGINPSAIRWHAAPTDQHGEESSGEGTGEEGGGRE